MLTRPAGALSIVVVAVFLSVGGDYDNCQRTRILTKFLNSNCYEV